MRPAEMPVHRWVRITPTERDSIRLGNLGWSVPSDVSPWPETNWGWIILNSRFAHERALEERYTRAELPLSFRMREAIFMDAKDTFERPKKEVRSMKKMLQRAFETVKSWFTGPMSVPIR